MGKEDDKVLCPVAKLPVKTTGLHGPVCLFFTDPQPIFTGHVMQADQTLRSALWLPEGQPLLW